MFDVAWNAIGIGAPVLYLLGMDAGWIGNHITEAETIVIAVMFAAIGVFNIGWGIHYLVTDETAKAIPSCLIGILYLVIAWETWKRGRPPRKRKPKLKAIVQRIGNRLVLVPVPVQD